VAASPQGRPDAARSASGAVTPAGRRPPAADAALGADERFEAAADAICSGDLAGLSALLDRDPRLVAQRSAAAHRATLLHHVAANGVEASRQRSSPANAVEILRLLLERGAEPDAICETYAGGPAQTTLCLLVSSAAPAAAGVEVGLVEELCRGEADPNGIDDDGLPLWTAIIRGHAAAAEALGRCGARVEHLVFAASLGDLAAVERHFDSDGRLRHPRGTRIPARIGAGGPPLDPCAMLEYALIWAAANGRRAVVELLLTRRPDLTATEPLFGSTALGMARYHHHDAVAALLEAAAPS
jgi:ankyrin repeat protein